MKIVHAMGFFMPEFGYQEYYLAKEHAKMGHEVHVVASDRLYPFENVEKMFKDAELEFPGKKREPGISKRDGFTIHWLPSLLHYIDFVWCRDVSKTLDEIKPDVVFSHESRQGLPIQVGMNKKRLGFSYIVDQHDFYHKIPGRIKSLLRNTEYFGFRRFLIDSNFKKAKKVIAVTKHTREFLKRTHHLPEKKIELIELGVDTDTYYPREREADKKREGLGIKKDEIVIMFVGTIYRRKNIGLLLDAFNEIRVKQKTRLLVVGDGEKDYMAELKTHAKELGLGDQVIFTGFVPKAELPAFYSLADIGVWPANNSVSIIEGMACKLPIIMVDWQMPHLVSHENGFKFPFNDKERLTKHMTDLVSDDRLRERMAKNSLDAARERYSYRRVAERFIEVAKE